MTIQLALLFVWPIVIGVAAGFWAARPRTTRLALGIEFGVFIALTLLRFGMNIGYARMLSVLDETRSAFPWVDTAYLLVIYAAVCIGLVIGWRRGHHAASRDRQAEVASVFLVAVDSAASLDAAMPSLTDYFAQDPDGLVTAVPALSRLSQRDRSLRGATKDEICERLAAAGFEVELASELAIVLSE